MIDLIRKYFGKSGGNGPSDQREEKSHDIRIATCALFLEMSNIDGEFSEGEKERILNILKRDYQLSDEHATELMEVSNGELKGSIDLWQFTNGVLLIRMVNLINTKIIWFTSWPNYFVLRTSNSLRQN
ncbi:MAG: TerB family tellurite resistance protein [Deltaproteobacteria bacterium]|nr:TerB family tellurite resistance protein [Deltaproteobacteria bacterium]